MPKKKVPPIIAEEALMGESDEFLDEDEHQGTHAEHSTKIQAGEQDADIYTEEGREDLEDSDELAPWEEGFSEGAEGSADKAVCAQCGSVLGDREGKSVEREIKGVIVTFCSEKCAGAGKKGKEK